LEGFRQKLDLDREASGGGGDKSQVARELAKKHYQAEAGLQSVFRLTGSAEVELRPIEPIKLLEVNTNTVASGAARTIWPGTCQRDSIPLDHRRSFSRRVRKDQDEGIEAAEGLASRRGDAQASGWARGRMMASLAHWARGYARQAHADFQSWQAIESDQVAEWV
jgi:hypothetical protein